jgi:hypothetical protein
MEGNALNSSISSIRIIVAMTFHPFLANSKAVSFPMPLEAPVMSTFFKILFVVFVKILIF